MKEFMMFILAEGDPVARLSPEEQQNHIRSVGAYIENLAKEGKLKAAQPLEMTGAVVSRRNGTVGDGPFPETKEVIAGYYHLLARDLEEAIQIAKADPRFEDADWKIEVRPIRTVEGIN